MKTTKLFFLAAIVLAFAFTACNPNEETPKEYTHVYFMDVDNEDIESLALADGKSDTITKGLSGIGIAYDKKNEKIIYSDFTDDTTPNGKIIKMDVNGSNPVTLVSGLLNPYGIALDSDNAKIYWGDENGHVSRCNLDGTGKEDIVTIDGGKIRALAVDHTNDKLYFYEVMNNNLYKANLDGSNKSVIITGYFGYAIAVDEKNSKIYFDVQTDDETISALYYANLDGSNPVMVDDSQSRIYGIVVDSEKSKVYWSARDMDAIYKANLNGTEKVTLNPAPLASPRGIFLKY